MKSPTSYKLRHNHYKPPFPTIAFIRKHISDSEHLRLSKYQSSAESVAKTLQKNTCTLNTSNFVWEQLKNT